MRNYLTFILCIAYLSLANAQAIKSVTPLTNKVLVVHFDEGDIDYHLNGELNNSDKIYVEPLDTEKASMNSMYSLTSIDHAFYSSVISPVEVHRKSKGTAFGNLCQGWQYLPEFGLEGCKNSSIDHIKEHWIYLELPEPMVDGYSYSLTIDKQIHSGSSDWKMTFDSQGSQSDLFHINNIGYADISQSKYAYLYQWMGDGEGIDLTEYENGEFSLINVNTGEVDFSGQLEFRMDRMHAETGQNNHYETPNQNFLGADVYECDFSSFDTPGTYQICVVGIGCSQEFVISCSAYRPAFEAVMSGIFQNRSGIAITDEYTNQPRPAPHNPALTPGFKGRLKYSKAKLCDAIDPDASEQDKTMYEDGILGELQAYGWYQDAGDWDGYLSHMNIPTKLLFMYDEMPQNFEDGQLSILENGNDIPDILDEARWLLRFYKRLRDETLQKGWTTGGVPGSRIFPDLWGPDLTDSKGRGSWEDTDRDWIVSGEDLVASFWYAAVASHYAYVMDKYGYADPEGIDWVTESIQVYVWANARYEKDYYCHSYDVRSLKNYAAASLFKLTAAGSFNADFKSSWEDMAIEEIENLEGMEAFGAYLYLKSAGDQELKSDIAERIVATADFYLLYSAEERACRWGGNYYYPMLAGQATGPKVFEGIMAYNLVQKSDPVKAAAYMRYLYSTADYFLGTNPLKMTWISGLDEHSPKGIFHLDDWYSEKPNIRKGIVPYGPWEASDIYSSVGPFNHRWAEKTVYPSIEKWPGHERWFGNRNAPLTNEFTIDETNLNAALLYGMLSGDASCSGLPSSIAQLDIEPALKLYPNPSSGIINIDFDSAIAIKLLQVYDLAGKKVHEVAVDKILDNIQIDISHLNAGIYNLQSISGTVISSQKLIKI